MKETDDSLIRLGGIAALVALVLSACGTTSAGGATPTVDASAVDGSQLCAAGGTTCGDTCVDTATDANNCGRCGGVCADGSTCQASVCAAHGGAFGVPCNTNGQCASGLCLPSGVCTASCAGASPCPPGPEWTCDSVSSSPPMCACTLSGSEQCDGRDNNCDGLVDNGATCSQPGYTCQAGTCACEPSGLCGGRCVDRQTDSDHCGSCGRRCTAGTVCRAGDCHQAELTATTASLTGAGLSDCGATANDACARSLLVSGGTFHRGTDSAAPAIISDFRLDKYEVTVGRFRRFVDAWVGGWRPATGSGKHTHLNSGSGLAATAGGYEPGWSAGWTNYPGAGGADAVIPVGTSATTAVAWTQNLSCSTRYQMWTSAAGESERKPVNCLSWYDLHAFCIWDGGFLPSEAEWEYAAAGGNEERTYTWGDTAPGTNASLAVYGCYYNGSGNCTRSVNVAAVGSVGAGDGKWGQSDLAGNVSEWNLDGYKPFSPTCIDCANVSNDPVRLFRGGSFGTVASTLLATYRAFGRPPASRYDFFGGRCARTP